jgi:uncharacterized membrane protein YeaQ/YmgE (transglycosylase-associated protein family)
MRRSSEFNGSFYHSHAATHHEANHADRHKRAARMHNACATNDGLCLPSSQRRNHMLHWLWVFIIGLIVGIIAKWIMPGKDPGGFIITAIIGIIGSFIGGWLASLFGFGVGATAAGAGMGGFWGFLWALIGAIVLLFIYHLIRGKKQSA